MMKPADFWGARFPDPGREPRRVFLHQLMLGKPIDSAHVCAALWQASVDGSYSPNQGRVSEKDDAAAGRCDSEVVRAGHGGHAKRCHGLAAAGALRFAALCSMTSPL